MAVVLKVVPRGEDDLLCDLFTEREGRIWGLARSGRKSRKRFGTTLAAGNILQVTYEEKGDSSLVFLRSAGIAVPLTHLGEDLLRIGTTFFFLETVRVLSLGRVAEPKKFSLLKESLQAVNRGEEPGLIRRRFERELLRIAGMEPHLESCLRCGQRRESYFFVLKEGGLFCEKCLPPGVPFEQVPATETGHLFTPFLEYCMGKRIQSKDLCLPA